MISKFAVKIVNRLHIKGEQKMNIMDRLKKGLDNIGFTKVQMRIENIHLFYRPLGSEVEIVGLFYIPMGDELDVYEYERIIIQIKKAFTDFGYGEVRFLGLLLTEGIDLARCLILDNDSHWLIDLNVMTLLIYENQNNEFKDVREELENSLEDHLYNRSTRSIKWKRPSEKIVWFTPINTGLIIINILTYIIVHNVSLFWETEIILRKGALSWFFIKEGNEYYRLLTSMFLHSNFSHLMNNMLVLFFVGDKFERTVGKIRYIIVYFTSGILAGITSVAYNMINDRITLTFSIGASGAIFGIVGAMLYVLIRNKGKIENISSRQIVLFAIFSLYGGFSTQGTDNAAHIGGFLAGILLAMLVYRCPKKMIKDQEEREVYES